METMVNNPAHVPPRETSNGSGLAIGIIVGVIISILVGAAIFLAYGRSMTPQSHQGAPQQQYQNPAGTFPEGQTPLPGADLPAY